MRKFLLSSALLLGMGASAAHAQSNAIKINIFSPLVRTVSIFGEHALNENSSAQLGFYYTRFSVGDTKFGGFGITPEYRYYLSDEVMNGFYVAPFLRYQSLTMKLDDYRSYYYDVNGNYVPTSSSPKATLSTIGGGLLIGYQRVFKKRITFDSFIGPSFNSGSIKVKSGGANENVFETGSFDGFGVRLGITLGVAF